MGLDTYDQNRVMRAAQIAGISPLVLGSMEASETTPEQRAAGLSHSNTMRPQPYRDRNGQLITPTATGPLQLTDAAFNDVLDNIHFARARNELRQAGILPSDMHVLTPEERDALRYDPMANAAMSAEYLREQGDLNPNDQSVVGRYNLPAAGNLEYQRGVYRRLFTLNQARDVQEAEARDGQITLTGEAATFNSFNGALRTSTDNINGLTTAVRRLADLLSRMAPPATTDPRVPY
jgi:hypothetical protein